MISKKHISAITFAFGAIVLVLAAHVALNFKAALFVAILLLGGVAFFWRLLERRAPGPDGQKQARRR